MMKSDVLFDIPKKKKSQFKKSTQFKGAYIIPDRRGHYFLNDNVQLENGRIAVQYVFYDGKWRQDTAWFSKEEFDLYMSKIS